MMSLRSVVLAAAVMVLFGANARAGSVALTGPDGQDGSYSPAQLAGLANASDTVSNGVLTGISLWGLLGGSDTATSSTNAAGTTKDYGQIATFNPTGANSNPNYDLRYYVTGTGSNGTTAVSLGQIDPGFVGTSQPVPFVAYQTAGGAALAAPELVIPGGPSGSTILNLTNLQLHSVAALPQGPGGVSTGVTVAGNVTNPNTTYTQFPGAFTPTTLNVLNSSNQITDTYTGIPLATFLNVPAGVDPNSQIVVAAGTDGYELVYSLDELLNADGTANPNALLAYAATGTDFPGDGIARTIIGSDGPFKHGRYESNLESLDVLDTTPIPAALPLFVTGLGALSLLGWRKKRINGAALAAA
jgi:hypothetical protein